MRESKIFGRVHKFGDNINTDLISPAQYMELSNEEIAAHAMEGADLHFPQKVKPGDIVVAGRNFGGGSSRETAPIALKGAGVSLVIAELFARIFYRNCINIGLPIVLLRDTSAISDGDLLDVDLLAGTLTNQTTGQQYSCEPMPAFMMDMLLQGGLLEQLEYRLKKEAEK